MCWRGTKIANRQKENNISPARETVNVVSVYFCMANAQRNGLGCSMDPYRRISAYLVSILDIQVFSRYENLSYLHMMYVLIQIYVDCRCNIRQFSCHSKSQFLASNRNGVGLAFIFLFFSFPLKHIWLVLRFIQCDAIRVLCMCLAAICCLFFCPFIPLRFLFLFQTNAFFGPAIRYY